MFPRLAKCLVVLTLLVVPCLRTTHATGQVISYDPERNGIRLIQKVDLDGEVASELYVRAHGIREVTEAYASVAGVLFQATAQPEGPTRPIRLNYRSNGKHDATLLVTIGQNEVTSDVPAWVWAVAARFADHECNAAVTLRDKPATIAEKKFERRWRRDQSPRARLLWARYHPVVDDTLVGFFLFAADAILSHPEYLRTISDGLIGLDRHSGYVAAIEPARSLRAARLLKAIIDLEAKPGDRAMLNDLKQTFSFNASNSALTIAGEPNYRFAREVRTSVFEEIGQLTDLCGKNRHLFPEMDPIIYKTVDDFAKLVAFFNYVSETTPDEFDEFVNGLEPILQRIPTFVTPIALPLSIPFERARGSSRTAG